MRAGMPDTFYRSAAVFGLYAVLSGYVFKRMAMHAAAVRSSALLQICVSVHSCFHKRIAMRVASVGGDAEQGQFCNAPCAVMRIA